MAPVLALALLPLLFAQAAAAKVKAAADPTPVSKVVELLGILKSQLETDKENDEKQFNEYDSWFKEEIVKVQRTVGDSNQSIESLQAELQEEEANREAFQMDLAKVIGEEAKAEKDLKEATYDR